MTALAALVLFGAAEEFSPKLFGVGVPWLFAAAFYFAAERKSVAFTWLFAVAAGLFEDSLSSLPFALSSSYFLFSSALVREARLGAYLLPVACVGYQCWLWLWLENLNGGIFLRALAAVPTALVAVFIGSALLRWFERKGALDVDD